MNISPQFQKANSILIIFSIDKNYLRFALVCLTSLIRHASTEHNYDINIIHTDITPDLEAEFLSSLPQFPENVKIRFIDITSFVDQIDLSQLYIEIHVTISTYFRFILPEIFTEYSKVLYLDCDLIIRDDVAEIFNCDLSQFSLAAVPDVRECLYAQLNLRASNKNWKNYVEKELGLGDYRKYFQAGVLLFNLERMRKNNATKRLFSRLSEIKTPILSDQDILNSVFCDDVCYLPIDWNVEWQIPFEFNGWSGLLSPEHKEYVTALANPKIIHYASPVKPWNEIERKNAHYWWQAARETAYYEIFMLRVFKRMSADRRESPARALIDRILPIGSYRRLLAGRVKRLIIRG